jgi:hypothetical protein
VRSVGDGFRAEEVWQCTNAVEKRTWRKVLAELQWFHRDVWSVGSAAEPSVGSEISRGINVCMSGVNQCRSIGVVQWEECLRWFKSAGGLSMHRKRIHTNK